MTLHLACGEDLVWATDETLSIHPSSANAFGAVQTSHGVLRFESEEHSNQVMEAIRQLEDDLEEYLTDLHGFQFPDMARYQAIIDPSGPFSGFNPINGQPLPQLSGEAEKVDDDPIKYLFEAAYDYHSLRRYLLDLEYDCLADGTFDGNGRDPEDHFVADDNLRMMLNDQLEWQVGENYYKMVSSSAIIAINGPTAEHMSQIRGEFPPPIAPNGTHDQPDPIICYGNPYVQEHPNITVIDFDDNGSQKTCAASFGHTVIPGSNNEVDFTNQSSGTFSSLQWEFGDGSTSTQTHPTHAYGQPGTFMVRLTLYDGSNVCDVQVQTINVSTDCEAEFTYSATASNPAVISFQDYSTAAPGHSIVQYVWDYDDNSAGDSGIVSSPNHTFPNSGTYNVCLTIKTSDSCKSTYCQMVSITTSECCRTNKRNNTGHDVVPYGSNRGYKGKLWIYSLPGYYRVGSKTIHYRQKNNGKWVKEKADYIYCAVAGTIYDHICAEDTSINIFDSQTNRKSIQITRGFGQRIRTQQGELYGAFRANDNSGSLTNGSVGLLQPNHCN